MSALYNEIEPYAARWLRNLTDAGCIAEGVIDARDIRTVQPAEVAQATQFHAFAGIGVWSHALRLAGWPDDVQVWTGSCPCQPFSVAGTRRGAADPRHLWPEWRRLIAQCRPTVIFGEQVASKAGRAWLAAVRADLEALEYAVGAADLCAAGAGAPHIRQRLFWVAHAESARRTERIDAARLRAQRQDGARSRDNHGLGDTDRKRRNREHALLRSEEARRNSSNLFEAAGAGFWADHDLVECIDGKARPVEPGTFPLAHGVTARVGPDGSRKETSRVGMLKAYGNAIVPQVAAIFVQSFMEATNASDA